MKVLARAFPVLTLLLAFLVTEAVQAERQDPYASWNDLSEDLIEKTILRQWIPMRDGVRLDAEIYLPNTADPPYPTVLIRSPYPSDMTLRPTKTYTALVENGYAIVFQNERGRYWSEGEHEYIAQSGEDGYDTVDWVAKQDGDDENRPNKYTGKISPEKRCPNNARQDQKSTHCWRSGLLEMGCRSVSSDGLPPLLTPSQSANY